MNCGAPAAPPAAGSSISTVAPAGGPNTDQSPLHRAPIWNIWLVSALSLLLGFLFGTILVALNWHSLKRHKMACVAGTVGVLDVVFVQAPLPDMLHGVWPDVVGFLAWFPLLVLPQLLYLQNQSEHSVGPRPWSLPVGLGIAAQVIFFSLGAAASQSSPTSAGRPESAQAVYAKHADHVIEIAVSWTEPYMILFSQFNGCSGSAVLI